MNIYNNIKSIPGCRYIYELWKGKDGRPKVCWFIVPLKQEIVERARKFVRIKEDTLVYRAYKDSNWNDIYVEEVF